MPLGLVGGYRKNGLAFYSAVQDTCQAEIMVEREDREGEETRA